MALDAPIEEIEEGRRVFEALIIDPEDEIPVITEIEKMLVNNDSRLKYVLDEEAIENPFAADREGKLKCLVDLFCERKIDGGYKCSSCDKEHNNLDEMHQHLLRHSKWKSYFCVRCLEGFSTLLETAIHTMTHIDAILMRESGPKSVDKSKSSGNVGPPQSPKLEVQQECRTEEEHNKAYRCTICEFTFDRLDLVLSHAEQQHPTERDVINRLRLQLLRAAFDPMGYRLKNTDQNESV